MRCLKPPKGQQGIGRLAFCKKLFKLEDEWATLSPDDRLVRRMERSKPV